MTRDLKNRSRFNILISYTSTNIYLCQFGLRQVIGSKAKVQTKLIMYTQKKQLKDIKILLTL